MKGAFGALETQVETLNAQLAKMVALQNGVDASGYNRLAKAAAMNDKVFRSAVASTGMFEQMQLRVNSATDDYIKKLNAQKLSFRDMMKQRKIAAAAYKEQLALENMIVRQGATSNSRGRQMFDVAYPREVSKELNTARKELAYFNEHLKSGAHQMVNWGKNTQWAGRQLMVGFTMPLAAAGAAAGVLAYQIDKELTRIAKVYDTTANANSDSLKDQMAVERELMKLREDGMATAMKSAREYGVAAQDTLNVQAELAATGLKGVELQKATAEIMRISRLGELEHQDAINASIALQATFKLSTQELTEAFNYMNAVENATSLQTKDFAAAIPIAAGVMKEWGGDIKELGGLLTAMRENGIGAIEGANAIKATFQRLTRPSKQIRQEWAAMTGTDITKLVDGSDSLTEVFQRINDVTKTLSDADRKKAFGGLFGSYQVARMMAMTKGMEDLTNGVGQVSTAYQLAKGDAKDWAATAEQELERYQKSVSGMWDTAYNEMKVQLSTFGGPFVEAATTVVKGVTAIMKTFSELPKGIKTFAAYASVVMALAGPVIMLTGLFANLAGNGLKILAFFLGLGQRFKILDKDSRVAELSTRLLTTTFADEKTAVQLLTAELNKFTLAQREANAAMIAGTRASAGTGAAATRQSALMSAAALGVQSKNVTNPRLTVDSAILARMSAETAESTAKSSRNIGKMAVGAASAASAMAIIFSSSEGTGGEIAKWVMYAGLFSPLIVPPITKMVSGFRNSVFLAGKLNNTMLKVLFTQQAIEASQTRGASAAAAPAGKMGRLASFATSPAGLAVAALTAVIGVAAYARHQEVKEAERLHKEQQEQIKAQVELNDITERWAAATGKTLHGYKMVSREIENINSEQEKSQYDKSLSFYRDEGKEGGGKAVQAFKEQANDLERNRIALLMINKLVNQAGMSIGQARTEMMAFGVATGKSSLVSQKWVDGLFEGLKVNKEGLLDMTKIMNTQFAGVNRLTSNFMTVDPSVVKKASRDASDIWVAEFVNAKTGQAARKLWEKLTNSMQSGAESARTELRSTMEDTLNELMEFSFSDPHGNQVHPFKELSGQIKGILNDPELFDSSVASGSLQNLIDVLQQKVEGSQIGTMFNKELGEFEVGIGQASKSVDAMRQGFLDAARAAGLVGDEIETWNDFMNNMPPGIVFGLPKNMQNQVIKDQLAAFSKLRNEAYDNSNAFNALTGVNKKISEEEARMMDLINSVNKSRGLRMGETYQEALTYLEYGVKEVKKEAQALEDEDYTVSFTVDKSGIVSVRREAMSAVQNDMADMMRDDFDSRMENAMDSRQNYWDRAADAQSDQFARQQEALDAKWERRKDKAEEYWDNRVKRIDDAIKAEQKAEEKRQKMFDAEMDRISRLNEAQNRTIDFNVALNEGRFDEAAKIRNDVLAGVTSNALERAAGRGAERSDKRIESLEGRKDILDERREDYMKRLDKREKDEQRHLKKVQDSRDKALKKRTDADLAALKRSQDAERKSLEDRLKLFLNYTAKNEKDLRRHMDRVGVNYKWFGDNILKPKATTWGSWYGKSMKKHIREEGLKLASDGMWEKIGTQSVKQILNGMGFENRAEFRKFINTGEMPKKSTKKNPDRGNLTIEGRHEGGFVGTGGGSRKGVARTARGLHHSEQMVRAQKGEFVVNRNDASKNANLLEKINRGESPYGNDFGIGGFGGPAAYAAAFAARGLIAGVETAFKNVASNASSPASFASGIAGMYGQRTFDAEQLKNAAKIASVGSGMGMSTRDIMIGIMTAITESGLRNIAYGDRDSVGLFQQRTSQGWGTVKQIMDPDYSARKFFEGLRGVGNRNKMDPWLAAQAVQRSFDATGANYRQYWDEAQAIFGQGLSRTNNGSFTPGGFIQGAGGRHRPTRGGVLTQGLHPHSAVDIGVPVGTPVYAAADGRVVASYDIPGYEPRARHGGLGYRSYGRVVEINHGGFSTLYAHLSQRYARDGQQVKGGSRIGLSGDTGNSSGPHLHFGTPGVSPYAFLKKGGTVKKDNTPAVLHRDERVLTAPLTKKLDVAIDRMYKYGTGGSGYWQGRSPNAGVMGAPTNFTYEDAVFAKKNKSAKAKAKRGSGMTVRTGTYNVYVGSSAKATKADLAKLMPKSDILSLTEWTPAKQAKVTPWLRKQGWNVFAGGGSGRYAMDASIAWNDKRLALKKGGTQKLGDKTGNFLGGRGKRYAKYGLFEDRATGSRFWQISAHTTTMGPNPSKRQREMHTEQYNALDRLIGGLKETGIPVFAGGDWNQHKNASFWRNPGGLKSYRNSGIDHVFADPRMAKLFGQQIVSGMNSDHKTAYLSSFNIPGLAKGTQNVRFNNTLANLHRGEAVLTEDINRKFKQGVERFANGGNSEYNVNVNVTNPNASPDEIADKVIAKLKREESRKPSSRRGG